MNKVDISYASKSEHNFAQRIIIKTIEQLTGKRKLQKIYNEYSLTKPIRTLDISGLAY